MIQSIEFKLLSPQIVKKMAAAEITKTELYDTDGFPIEGGIMDPRLGVADPGLKCRTCGGSMGECTGHFGFIELVRPVIHALYIKFIYKLLKSMCSSCGRIIEEQTTAKTQTKKQTKKKCQFCGADHVSVKFEKPHGFIENEKMLTPIQIRQRLEKIPDEDLVKFGFKGGRPEWLIITLLPIPPVTTRPSITLETGGRSEDDLTHKLVDIIRINQRLKENIEIGAPDFIIEDLWELLQYHVSTFFDNELSGIPQSRHRSGRALKTLSQRLKSKEGRFRQNLTGKRVNFSARTVISPDPYLSINEVGVPLVIAKELTIPVYVQEGNIQALKELIKVKGWPSANYVIRPDGKKKKIVDTNKEEIAEEIAIDYIVERQLQNGDFVLFNRQPSLHRMSIMAHRVRVVPWRTFTHNLAVCFPYNSDFDGDEMNLHVPQTVEARAEIELLMEVQKHIRSPRFGGPLIGCEQDHITGNYFLTKKETSLPREDAFSILADIGVVADVSNEKTFSGKEIFSYLLPKDLNIDFKAKACHGCENCKKEECPYDCFVVIKNGKLKSGVIDSKAIGTETGRLIDVIEKEYSIEDVHKFIDRITLLGIKYLEKRGFSIGLDDTDLPKQTMEKIKASIQRSKAEVDNIIKLYEAGQMEILPGRDVKESLEFHILRALAKPLDETERMISSELEENAAVAMARSGARGGLIHIAQMTAFIGQIKCLGERIKRGYSNRTLPHFTVNNLSPEAHGFVVNSYKSGLSPFEFFFDAMSGREGLMDKSLRTRHSGYMERRLMNALQDLKIEYDNTVRDNRKVIIQFVPGEDKIDPSKSDWGFFNVRNIVRSVVR